MGLSSGGFVECRLVSLSCGGFVDGGGFVVGQWEGLS